MAPPWWMSLRRETYNALPRVRCLVMNCTHSSDTRGAAHSCPPLSTSLRLAKFAGLLSLLSSRWHASHRREKERRDGLSLLEKDVNRFENLERILLSSIRKIIFERIFLKKKKNRSWKMEYSLNYINLGCLGRGRVQLRVSWIIRRNVQTHKSQACSVRLNQLTGNYREINHFCASLHESLDDVAKSRALCIFLRLLSPLSSRNSKSVEKKQTRMRNSPFIPTRGGNGQID